MPLSASLSPRSRAGRDLLADERRARLLRVGCAGRLRVGRALVDRREEHEALILVLRLRRGAPGPPQHQSARAPEPQNPRCLLLAPGPEPAPARARRGASGGSCLQLRELLLEGELCAAELGRRLRPPAPPARRHTAWRRHAGRRRGPDETGGACLKLFSNNSKSTLGTHTLASVCGRSKKKIVPARASGAPRGRPPSGARPAPPRGAPAPGTARGGCV